MSNKAPEDLKKHIDAYFELSKKQDELATLTGLALFLNVTKDELLNCSAKDEYAPIYKYAKLKIENAYEQRLIKRGNSGDIFALRVLGWNDKQQSEQEEGFIYTAMQTIKVDEENLNFNIGDNSNVGTPDNS